METEALQFYLFIPQYTGEEGEELDRLKGLKLKQGIIELNIGLKQGLTLLSTGSVERSLKKKCKLRRPFYNEVLYHIKYK